MSCQAKLNEAGNLLIEVTEPSTSRDLARQLSKVNMQWAECMKRTMFVSNVLTALSSVAQNLHKGTIKVKLMQRISNAHNRTYTITYLNNVFNLEVFFPMFFILHLTQKATDFRHIGITDSIYR